MSGSRIELSFEGEDIVDLDLLSRSDPFVVVYQRFEDGDDVSPWREMGRTETIMNTRNPKFKKTVTAPYEFNHVQAFKFEVYDRDAKSQDLHKHDFIGSAEINVARVNGRSMPRQTRNSS